MSKSLFDVDGNYVGDGGQGFMTQPGVDPTGGGHAKVVTEGVKTMEEEAQPQPQPVANVKPNLVGWNGWKPVESSNGGQSEGGSTAIAEKKVVIPRREDRPAAYPTKTRREADDAASIGQELTDEQKAAVQSAGATPSPLSQTEQEAEKQDIEAGNKGEVVTGATSENANGTDDADKTVVADNGGQSDVPKTDEAKTESPKAAEYKPQYIDSGINDDDYKAAKKRKEAAEANGEIPDWDDVATVFRKENPYMKEPELPELEEFVPKPGPTLKSIDSSYRTAYAIMEQRMKAAGDDPASKAKRAKARRAELIVAALGDLLQVAANMWGAARGATSAKLSSISAGVKKRHTAEDAMSLNREAQYAKDLETAIKRDEKLTKEQNDRADKLWKAAEDARKYNVEQKNKTLQKRYEMWKQMVSQHNAQVDRDFHQAIVAHDRKLQAQLNNRYLNERAKTQHGYRSSEIGQRTAGSIARAQESGRQSRLTKQTASYKDLHGGSSSSSPISGNGSTIKKGNQQQGQKTS